jgi:hypothetical protein
MYILRVVLILGFVCASAAPAAAQAVYVAGSVGADMLFVSGADSFGVSTATGGGEAISGAARLGVVRDERWGIELEVSRAAEIEEASSTGGILPLALASTFPIFLPEIDVRTRTTTISTTASIRQQVADRTALVYLGGIVFHRIDTQFEYRARRGQPNLADFVLGQLPVGSTVASSSFAPSLRTESVQYGVGPVVGFEAHIGYGEHLTIVPGVRMHGLPNSWLLRPAVGVGWRF